MMESTAVNSYLNCMGCTEFMSSSQGMILGMKMGLLLGKLHIYLLVVKPGLCHETFGSQNFMAQQGGEM